jgi:hypothetical protein
VGRNARLLGLVAAGAAVVALVGAESTSARPVTERPLIAHWDGTSWTKSPDLGFQGTLNGVLAVSSSDAWAVGSRHFAKTFTFRPLIARWNGSTWRPATLPSLGRHSYGEFTDVAGSSATDVWAVGYRVGNVNAAPLIEHWDGTRWRITPSPNVHATGYLTAVSALSPTDAWAVGSYASSARHVQTLSLHWNGTQWTRVPTPNPASPGAKAVDQLSAVLALSADDVWAAGNARVTMGTHHAVQTLVLHWDGGRWTRVPSPNEAPLVHGSLLLGLASAGPEDVWAVGRHGTGHGQVTLVERWNGQAWEVAKSPTGPTRSYEQQLGRATVVSATDVWAAGGYAGAGLLEHWDGNAWSTISFAGQPPTSTLYGISAASSKDVWAVGQYLKP